jgi:hypothetical protein
MCRRAPSGDAAEDGTRDQPVAAGVIVVVEFADDLTGGPTAAER